MEPAAAESSRPSQAGLAYAFFQRAACTGQCFTAQDVADSTGYSLGTTKNYLTKKWWWFVQKGPEGYTVQNLGNYSLGDFQRDLRQKTPGPAPTAVTSITEVTDVPPAPSLELTLAFIALCLLWAIALRVLRKRSWWFLPV